MNNQNIKIYIGISLALIVLLILILVIPFSKKTTNNQSSVIPSPTQVTTNPSPAGSNQSPVVSPTPIYIKSGFTGGINDQLPKPIMDLATQKKDLRQKTPFNLGAFSIDFDYNQDKFLVTLTDPKDNSQKAFDSWKTANYPALNSSQFIFK